MSIKFKIILIVLPLILLTLILTVVSSYQFATKGITDIAQEFLKFKSEEFKKLVENQWSLLTSYNLTENEEFVQSVKSTIQANALGLIKSQSELIFALDAEGNIGLSTSEIKNAEAERSIYKKIFDQKESRLFNPVFAGKERVAIGFYFEPFDWYFLITEEMETFYKTVTNMTILSLIILVASLIISTIVLYFFASYLTRPLTKVVNTMKDIISYNDLTSRVVVEYKDETGELAHTFNLMIGELEKAYNQIKSYAFKSAIAQKKEKKVRQIFQKYVPRDVIDQFFAHPESMLVGENRVLSVLFSDIRGFTTISEGMQPDELVQSLNRYFSVMVDIIMGQNGIIDKFIGDAIMAFFGAPVKHENDALASVLAGIEMTEALDTFNKNQDELGLPAFHTGIGINYGVVTVGNIGSEKKMDYTVIGDMVNLASRLEGLTKQYKQKLIISESLRNKVVDDVFCRMLDKVAVKGKTRGVNIYSVERKLNDASKKGWYYHGEAMRNYYGRDFKKAKEQFREIQKYLPGDYIAEVFMERCDRYAVNPPPENWDGLEKMTSK
ncbi:MAG: HAMP domain-containing protein [Spirochaetales bacterium]|nr:HAMP domain-containing protein [Spirochaetales bacterium]